MQEEKFFYQPNLVNSIIIWSWTTLILLLGIIFWLEITHFQWITAVLFIIFIGLSALQIFRRTLKITPDALIFSRMLQKNYLTIQKNNLEQLRFTNSTLQFTASGQTFYFTFTPHSLATIKRILADN
ncbi:hypothetical protein FC70_GL001668 [Paucilactobacillus oligofermentans DSM 15707 = LMG 22743]|uniref:Pore-forming protein n=1 Tax=Paucilactobacillus oligofermentans DSM 15707 = LMG 22743 TaxID=1423778 RepID=A0A0R1RKQ3_9LACO|nr:EbsA family protein [Paucilactobacillus oligofermentans]KRL54866.1 hypothetical protein FC70_GL001668 [Paucilactobacillus oligofermentans DSM 15707 = LMG 22743]CUS26219.1 Putative membrane protein [Paucilactobacillus oligofermentans DSM 15707 = LMG 22743]